MERILSFSTRLALLPEDGLILCALSGGRDSVALLHFLKAHGCSVAAAHFDHRLRENSAADADFCRRLCAEWGVPFYQGEGDVAKQPGNTEANARAARYAFLERVAAEIGAAAIATAHNADDNLETVLLHLTRGCGLNGLTGIQPRRGLLIRPMLKTPRAAIDAYVEEFHLPFVEDETNADDKFSRNRLRHQVLPVLKTINPRVVEVAGTMTDTLREDHRFLEENRPRPKPDPTPITYPPLSEMTLTGDGRYTTPLWTLELRHTPSAPNQSPTPNAFFLHLGDTRPFPQPPGDAIPPTAAPTLFLRPRRPGDAVHPPFRTGKSVKKWMNELKIPQNEREITPVLTDGKHILSVAGIGPNKAFLAHPGQESIFVRWTKKREETDR